MIEHARAEIHQLSATLASMTEQVQQHAGPLSINQLNWKPNDSEWSVGQCLDHLIVTNSSYFPQIDQVLVGNKRAAVMERMPWLPSLYGRLMIKMVGPNAGRSVPAPRVFWPTQSDVNTQIVAQFVEMQEAMQRRMASCANLPVDAIIITSPASSFVVYSVLDAFRIITVHEQNHFNQLMRLIQHPNFPTY